MANYAVEENEYPATRPRIPSAPALCVNKKRAKSDLNLKPSFTFLSPLLLSMSHWDVLGSVFQVK